MADKVHQTRVSHHLVKVTKKEVCWGERGHHRERGPAGLGWEAAVYKWTILICLQALSISIKENKKTHHISVTKIEGTNNCIP